MAAESSLGDKIIKRLSVMKTARQPHESAWKDCFALSFPARASGFDNDIYDGQNIQDRLSRIYDSTLGDSARTQGSAILSGLTPPNSQWVEFDVPHETEEERRWLAIAARLLWENIHASNYDAEAYEAIMDMEGAGWFVMFIDEDREQGGFLFNWYPVSSCYIASSKAGGAPDILYRPFTLTAEQAIAEFSRPGDTLSESVRTTAEKSPDAKIEFVRAIYPRQGAQGRMARNLPFASCTVECATRHVVRESGYHEQPFVAPRYSVIPNSPYGLGPVSGALPDARVLNEVKRMELAALDLAISGMWIATDDGVLNPRSVKVGPRKIIVANDVDSMKPLQSGSQFDVGFVAEERLQSSIRKVMMADQLQPQDGPAMTATEVNMRAGLIRQLLGPMLGRQQPEWLQPMVARCFGLAYRAGVFPQPPRSLAGKPFTVRYISPMARAQRMEDVGAIERIYATAGQIAQATGDPTLLDNLNGDKAMEVLSEALGTDKIMRDAEDIQQIRQARDEQQQAAAQQAMMQPTIDAAGKAAAQSMVGA